MSVGDMLLQAFRGIETAVADITVMQRICGASRSIERTIVSVVVGYNLIALHMADNGLRQIGMGGFMNHYGRLTETACLATA